jgi:hypothetical protein
MQVPVVSYGPLHALIPRVQRTDSQSVGTPVLARSVSDMQQLGVDTIGQR